MQIQCQNLNDLEELEPRVCQHECSKQSQVYVCIILAGTIGKNLVESCCLLWSRSCLLDIYFAIATLDLVLQSLESVSVFKFWCSVYCSCARMEDYWIAVMDVLFAYPAECLGSDLKLAAKNLKSRVLSTICWWNLWQGGKKQCDIIYNCVGEYEHKIKTDVRRFIFIENLIHPKVWHIFANSPSV